MEDSLLVDGEDLGSLVIDALVNEDSLDDGSGSPLDTTVVSVDIFVDDGTGHSDVSVSDDSSDSVDNSGLSVSESVDDFGVMGELASESVISGNSDIGVDCGQVVDVVRDDASIGLGDGEDGVDNTVDSDDLSSDLTDNLARASANSTIEGVVTSLSARSKS